jgi:hypothetical protein
MVIMVVMCILVEEFLCEQSFGWRQILKNFPVKCAWVPVAMSLRTRP